MLSRHWLVLALLLAPALASADDDEVMNHPVFVAAHPDMYWRQLGQEALKAGDAREAYGHFRKSAGYADKASQAMVAEMLWNGQGTDQDRALAYAWMDLAAERGYEGFVGHHERYWKALDEAERASALEVGQTVYARYGDQASEPRLAAVLRRERARQAGSRTGFTGALKIYIPGPGGDYLQIDGSTYYDERYWEPAKYRALQDSIWERSYTGRVDVGPVEQIGSDDHPNSRVPATRPQTDAPEPQSPEPDDGNLGTRPQP